MALQAILSRYVPNTIDLAAVLAQSQSLLADLSELKAADGELDRTRPYIAMHRTFVCPDLTNHENDNRLERFLADFMIFSLSLPRSRVIVLAAARS